MPKFITVFFLGILIGYGAFYSLYYNLNLPTKWLNPLGEEICVLDARGERTSLAPEAKYHVRYAEQCPSRDKYDF